MRYLSAMMVPEMPRGSRRESALMNEALAILAGFRPAGPDSRDSRDRSCAAPRAAEEAAQDRAYHDDRAVGHQEVPPRLVGAVRVDADRPREPGQRPHRRAAPEGRRGEGPRED